ncbi:hypothetical protein CAPTEDRAFT_181064 [Capitella teleta]|uniref:Mediator of RNA polymerase II transcription subunit 7 n=1 Tax=Capitella teleta TaxID=283909 RepID=R7UDQ0_CAPTE|nr:hypothetical protein CAPTEDRAFT_181064 [Capitella teleta]|eukprot:ELU01387.1 hypothetical protein CAPTEDRAFT_181064 [Capitella teleta]
MSGEAQPQNVSSLPLPPMQYINMYTDDNLKRGRAPKPPPPIKDQYSMFGVTFHADDQIIRPLESQNLRRLYPQNYDHKRELKKLNHSILVNFLDLLDILIKSPDSPKRPEKIDDLTLLFIHMHHLINEFRPHQARETLRVMMDEQRTQRLDTAQRFRRQVNRAQDLLKNALAKLPDDAMLDRRLKIKSEPADVKMEIKEENDMDAEDEAEPQCSTLDRMMCDIVDAMN